MKSEQNMIELVTRPGASTPEVPDVLELTLPQPGRTKQVGVGNRHLLTSSYCHFAVHTETQEIKLLWKNGENSWALESNTSLSCPCLSGGERC